LSNQALKIIQLIDTLDTGGAERMAVNMANLFQEKGIGQLLVATYRTGAMANQLHPLIPCYVLNKKNAWDIGAFIQLIKLVNKHSPTHIHAHSTSIVWGVMLKIVFPQLVLIWHDHFGLETQSHPRRYMQYLSYCINGMIGVKQELVHWAKRSLQIENLTYISNFPSLYLKSIEKTPNRIICVANMRRQKDIGNLIQAAQLIKESGIPFHIRIVGETPDKNYLSEITSQVHSLNLTNYINIVGTSGDIASELEQAEIGVLSSKSEGLPVALLEYGLARLPVAVTDAGQCREVVDNGHAGILVEVGNPVTLAKAIIHLLTNKSFAKQLGNNLNQRVENNYGETHFFNAYISFLNTLN
jgi:glycosyltransferase involved in cell wall biosynthesis